MNLTTNGLGGSIKQAQNKIFIVSGGFSSMYLQYFIESLAVENKIKIDIPILSINNAYKGNLFHYEWLCDDVPSSANIVYIPDIIVYTNRTAIKIPVVHPSCNGNPILNELVYDGNINNYFKTDSKALALAYLCGARQLYLFGFDYYIMDKEYKPGESYDNDILISLRNHLKECKEKMQIAINWLIKHNVEVYNCSPFSKFDNEKRLNEI